MMARDGLSIPLFVIWFMMFHNEYDDHDCLSFIHIYTILHSIFLVIHGVIVEESRMMNHDEFFGV